MEIGLNINGKEIPNINTTILHTSKYNYNVDIIELIHKNAEVITKNSFVNANDIPLKTLEKYNCLDLINKKKLTKIDETKLNVIKSLNSSKDIIAFYDVLNYIDNVTKRNVINELKNQNKRIINYTTEIEETLLLDYLIVVHENKVIMEGSTREVLSIEKIIKKLGFNMPLIVELSNGLKYYGCLDKTYFDLESMVNDLWK